MKKYSEKTIKYYDSIVDSYLKNGAMVTLGDRLDRFIGLLPGKNVLDVACGPGHDCDYFNKHGLECLGVDLSKNMIEKARKLHVGKFEVMDFFDLESIEKSLDGLWCSSIFVHIRKKDVSRILSISYNVLAANGIIGIITAAKCARKAEIEDTREYVMFEKAEMEAYLAKAGFVLVVSEIFLYGGKDRLFIIARKNNN